MHALAQLALSAATIAGLAAAVAFVAEHRERLDRRRARARDRATRWLGWPDGISRADLDRAIAEHHVRRYRTAT